MNQTASLPLPADWRDFFALTKPRVMSLVIFTGLCGLLAAPGHINPVLGFTAVLCIAMGAGGAAALNMWWEADLDAGMKRTRARPIPAGRMDPVNARDFGIALSVASVLLMGIAIGWLAASILALSIVYYAVIYTIWLKPRTPQNIVIGGGAGAFPPLIGWVAVTGEITLMPVLLFAIIFFWTPPHFWALALFVQSDYAKVGIPMMPVVAGEVSTRRQILVYACCCCRWRRRRGGSAGRGRSMVFPPWSSRPHSPRWPSRWRCAAALGEDDAMKPERQLFKFSIVYLFAIFAALVADRWLAVQG